MGRAELNIQFSHCFFTGRRINQRSASNVNKLQTSSRLTDAGLGTSVLPACSVKRIAVNKLGNALASGGTTFTSDEDPELVRDALPFSLKLIESLLAESPRHRGLLLAAASGFTPYAYAFVQEEADEIQDSDLDKSDSFANPRPPSLSAGARLRGPRTGSDSPHFRERTAQGSPGRGAHGYLQGRPFAVLDGRFLGRRDFSF